MRRLVGLGMAVSVALVLAPQGAAAQVGTSDFGVVLNILPPGQSGSINAVELAAVLLTDPVGRVAIDGRNAPANFANQLELYDAFNRLDPAAITDQDVRGHYKSATIAPADVARVERPRPGVTITWDRFGVPHIRGTTDADVAWGAGYAGTKDRMFLQDVLRHAGAARAAEFLGPAPENIAMDVEQLRSAFYTPAEAAAQLAQAASRNGELGAFMLSLGDAYLAGINAAQRAMCPLGLPTGLDCPAEYLALGRLPRPWGRADLTYVASLVGGIFGKGGGGEFANALWLQRLEQQFGPDEARRVYDDLRAKDDAEAPTTLQQRFEYGEPDEGVDPSRAGVALPDLNPAATAPGTGARLDMGGLPSLPNPFAAPRQSLPGRLRLPFGTIDLRAGFGMSNAALIGAAGSASDHPLAVFGPQTGYFTPQLLTEMALDGPRIKARGVAFAGTNLLVQIGRGLDYAWSATSSSADNVDTVVERLCNPDGSPATVNSTHYVKEDAVRNGACVPMERFEHAETALPTLIAPGLPQFLRFLVLRTHHGIVQTRTTVDGAAVAVVLQRSTYLREIDSVAGFAKFNMPEFVRDAASFQQAAGSVEYSFNWFYADADDIAYYASGRLPLRPSTVDFDLPRWGDPRHDWAGWLPFEAHPNAVNPPSGYLVNWNNKPAPGFTTGDNGWGGGPVHRSEPLAERVATLAASGAATPARLAAAVQDAATVDTRGSHVLPALLAGLGDTSGDPRLAEATAVLREWQARGAHREDRDRDGAYTDAAAIALFDTWWESAGPPATAVAKDALRGTLAGLVDVLPQALDDHPRQGLGSAFNGVAWYGYLDKDLRAIFGAPVVDPWHRGYCGGGDPAACRASLRSSLAAAVDRALAAQGVTNVRALRYDKQLDAIRPTTSGVVATRPMDWQNRPTFQQVVAFDRRR